MKESTMHMIIVAILLVAVVILGKVAYDKMQKNKEEKKDEPAEYYRGVLDNVSNTFKPWMNQTQRMPLEPYNRVLNNGVLDNGVLDNGVLDNGVLDNGVLNNGVLNNGVLNNGVLNNGVLNNGVSYKQPWMHQTQRMPPINYMDRSLGGLEIPSATPSKENFSLGFIENISKKSAM
jgi:hypothetical protein